MLKPIFSTIFFTSELCISATMQLSSVQRISNKVRNSPCALVPYKHCIAAPTIATVIVWGENHNRNQIINVIARIAEMGNFTGSNENYSL